MSVYTKMTAIADEIRTLSGTTDTMGLDAMATNVGNANTEINSQTDIIEQIIATLETKTAPSSGVELPSLTNEASASDMLAEKQLINSNNEVVTGTMTNNGAISLNIDGLTTSSATIPAGYTSGGTVSLTSDIEEALAAI